MAERNTLIGQIIFRVFIALVLLAGLVTSGGACAQTVSPTPEDIERDNFVRQTMKSAGFPGVQTVVVKNNRIVWQKSYGQAVLAQPGPARLMRDDSILYTASIGKMLTAVAVMQQVEKGRLSLDDDINAYVPFVVRNPKWPDVPITWRMVLTHTSSINDAEDVQEALYVYGTSSPLAFEEYVEGTFKPGGIYNRANSYLAGKPGTERIYSNNGLDLAGYAIARLVHQPFTTYVNQAILSRLGIKESSYSLTDLPASKLAVGYGRTLSSDGRWIFAGNRVAFGHMSAGRSVMDEQMGLPDPGSGSLYTSAVQFARLVMMLLNRGSLDGAKILEPASVDLLLTHSGYWSITSSYQQGVVFLGQRNLDDRLVWGHAGDDRGYCAAVFFDREAGIGALAFANAETGDFLLSRRLTDLDMHMLDWFK
jgi:CubicO group peptidase (beta-lactamase class C family)